MSPPPPANNLQKNKKSQDLLRIIEEFFQNFRGGK